MKYIRTIDGIYELKTYKEKYQYFKVNGGAWKLQKINECSQANTIEELCDEFMSVSSIVKVINNRLENIKILANKGDVIYGAIWTDAGLVYVAKMNEKGELELL